LGNALRTAPAAVLEMATTRPETGQGILSEASDQIDARISPIKDWAAAGLTHVFLASKRAPEESDESKAAKATEAAEAQDKQEAANAVVDEIYGRLEGTYPDKASYNEDVAKARAALKDASTEKRREIAKKYPTTYVPKPQIEAIKDKNVHIDLPDGDPRTHTDSKGYPSGKAGTNDKPYDQRNKPSRRG
jgi:hypothetical protein